MIANGRWGAFSRQQPGGRPPVPTIGGLKGGAPRPRSEQQGPPVAPPVRPEPIVWSNQARREAMAEVQRQLAEEAQEKERGRIQEVQRKISEQRNRCRAEQQLRAERAENVSEISEEERR